MQHSDAEFTQGSSLDLNARTKSTWESKLSNCICSICNSSFTNRDDFLQHIRTGGCGEGERFPCNICKKSYSYLIDLWEHKEIHHREKRKYVCRTCNGRFGRKSEVKCHRKNTRCGKPPVSKVTYNCSICHKSYLNVNELKKHNDIHHVAVKKYFCETCNTGFSERSCLILHKRDTSGCGRTIFNLAPNYTYGIGNPSFHCLENSTNHIKTVRCGNQRLMVPARKIGHGVYSLITAEDSLPSSSSRIQFGSKTSQPTLPSPSRIQFGSKISQPTLPSSSRIQFGSELSQPTLPSSSSSSSRIQFGSKISQPTLPSPSSSSSRIQFGSKISQPTLPSSSSSSSRIKSGGKISQPTLPSSSRIKSRGKISQPLLHSPLSSSSRIKSGSKISQPMSIPEHTYKMYVFKNTNSIDFSKFVSSKVDAIKNTLRAELESHCSEEMKTAAATEDIECFEIEAENGKDILGTFGTFRSQFVPILNPQDIDNTVTTVLEEAMSNCRT